ncbi:hypothetical protein Pfo_017539 [Paulownia fortunei]|nr:hypothetical protein Pfo_017539 [Paulownia fortunei]
MGRKRKVVKGSTIADEDKISNACPGTTSTEEKLHLHTDDSNAVEGMNVENNVQPNSNGSPAKNKNSGVTNVVIRRSGRLKSSVLPVQSRGVKPVVEHVNLDENEKEEVPHSQQVSTLPVLREKNLEGEPQVQQISTLPDVNERNLEEKVDYLVQAVDEFKSKVFGRPNEGPAPDFSYKSLYINSQKKIEALMEENYELVRKLEFALGKVEAYEKMKDTVGASKEVILVSSLGKAMEATVSLSPQTVQKCNPPAAAAPPDAADDPKRKKNNYKKKKAKP